MHRSPLPTQAERIAHFSEGLAELLNIAPAVPYALPVKVGRYWSMSRWDDVGGPALYLLCGDNHAVTIEGGTDSERVERAGVEAWRWLRLATDEGKRLLLHPPIRVNLDDEAAAACDPCVGLEVA